MTRAVALARSLALSAGLCSLAVLAADHVNPDQAAIDALNDKKALLEAKEGVAKAENALAKAESEAFPDSFGKKGALSLSGTDTVRVAAKTAQAFKRAATQIAEVLKSEEDFVVLLSDADRISIPIYRAEDKTLRRLLELARPHVEGATPEGAELLALGTMLSQVAQFTQLFRTDRSVTFVSSTLPEDLLFDLVAAAAPQKVLYPGAEVDSLLAASSISTRFGSSLTTLAAMRESLGSIKVAERKAAAAEVIAQIDQFLTRLAAVNESTKTIGLLSVLRGELASSFLELAKGGVLTVRVLAQGGTTLKTQSIWRSDRYFVSGNVAVSYRLVSKGSPAKVLRSDIVSSDEPFTRIPLE